MRKHVMTTFSAGKGESDRFSKPNEISKSTFCTDPADIRESKARGFIQIEDTRQPGQKTSDL
jgi:hypothetical protein